jgi:hypothetical protein
MWLGGRESTDAMKKAYYVAKDAYTPSRTPGASRPSTPPSAVGSGSRTNGSRIRTNPRFDTTGVRVDPSRIRTEGYTPPPSPSGPPTRRFPPGGGAPAPSPPPTGGGERLVGGKNIAERMAEAAKKLAARRGAAKPGMVKPDTNLGRTLKGGIVAAVGQHMLEDVGNAGSALFSGDYKKAGQRGLDLLAHTPFGFGMGAGDAASYAATGKALRDKPEGIIDRITHAKYLPDSAYGGLEKKPAAAKQEDNPAYQKPKGVGQKPLNPAPEPPSSLRGIGEQARGQSKAMRSPESYLGSAFDATLRKGIATGRNYLQNQMNKDGLDSDMQQKIMSKYNDKIADDELLKAKGNEQGLVGAINRNDATRSGASTGRGERTLEAYRNAPYGKGAKASEIQRKFVK